MDGFYYTPANAAEELEQFYALIRDVYCEEKQYVVDVPDAYDKQAAHFISKSDTQVIGGFRISQANDVSELPSGSCAELSLGDYKRCAEISRWAIRPEWRKKLSTQKTFRDFALYAQQNSLDFFLAKVTPAMIHFYERQGLNKIGKAFYDAKTFVKLNNSDNQQPNFQMMLLPAQVLYKRYL